ncbi:hypothetical protein ACSSS7_001439 [Eimeria intestinalis]
MEDTSPDSCAPDFSACLVSNVELSTLTSILFQRLHANACGGSLEAGVHDRLVGYRAEGTSALRGKEALAAIVGAASTDPAAPAGVAAGTTLYLRTAKGRKKRVMGLPAIVLVLGVTTLAFLISRCVLHLSIPRFAQRWGLPEPPSRKRQTKPSADPSPPSESATSLDESKGKEEETPPSTLYSFPLIDAPQARKQLGNLMTAIYNTRVSHEQDFQMALNLSIKDTDFSLVFGGVKKKPSWPDREAMKELVSMVEEVILESLELVEQGKPKPTEVSVSREMDSKSEGELVGRWILSVDERPAEKPELTPPVDEVKQSPAPAKNPADKPVPSEEVPVSLPEEPAVSPPSSEKPAEEHVSEAEPSLPQDEAPELPAPTPEAGEQLSPDTETPTSHEEEPASPAPSDGEPSTQPVTSPEAPLPVEGHPSAPAPNSEPPSRETPGDENMPPPPSEDEHPPADHLEAAAEAQQPEQVESPETSGDQQTPEQTSESGVDNDEVPVDEDTAESEVSAEDRFPSGIEEEKEEEEQGEEVQEEETVDYRFPRITNLEVRPARRENQCCFTNRIDSILKG